jgi:TRAP-type C4-dicarboxylate transport system permease small subunit
MDIAARRVLEIVIHSIVILFSFFILVLGGLRLVNITFTLKQISPAMGLPMGYVYIVLPLTGILIIYYSIVMIISTFKSESLEPLDDKHITYVE